MISRVSLVKRAPRFASLAPFCRLICDHLLWPDIGSPAGARDCSNAATGEGRGLELEAGALSSRLNGDARQELSELGRQPVDLGVRMTGIVMECRHALQLGQPRARRKVADGA